MPINHLLREYNLKSACPPNPDLDKNVSFMVYILAGFQRLHPLEDRGSSGELAGDLGADGLETPTALGPTTSSHPRQ